MEKQWACLLRDECWRLAILLNALVLASHDELRPKLRHAGHSGERRWFGARPQPCFYEPRRRGKRRQISILLLLRALFRAIPALFPGEIGNLRKCGGLLLFLRRRLPD